MKHDLLVRLHDLAMCLETGGQLHERGNEIVTIAGLTLGSATCSIMLLQEGENNRHRLSLWSSNTVIPPHNTSALRQSLSGMVLKHGKPIFARNMSESKFASLALHRQELGNSFVSAPISAAGRIIGIINFANRASEPAFDETVVSVAGIVSTLLGKSLQVDQLLVLLKSRVAQATLAREEKAMATRLTDGTIPPSRLAKLLAKSFYRDLAAAGFESGQIIEVASEIIAQISGNIARAKKRIGREAI